MLEKDKINEFIESEGMLQVLTESSPDCIKLFNLEGELLYMNRGGLKEHRLESLEQAFGRKWQAVETLVKEDKRKFTDAFQDAMFGKTTTIEIMHTIAGSTRDVCSELISPVTNEKGEIIGVLGISRDITRLKKAEKELEEVKKTLERKVEEQTSELQERVKELEKFTSLLTEHEREMEELKREIDRLKKESEENHPVGEV